MLSESIHQAASRVLANNGRYLAVVDGALMIRQYPGPKAIARFDPFGSELTRSGIRRISWALDSRRLVMAGDGWLGAWQPFDPDQPAAAEALEMPEPVSAIALLDEPTRIAYAIDRVVTFRSLPQAPLAPPSSSWQRWLKSLPRPTVGQPGSTSWQWNVSPSGYDGVDVHNSHLTFFNVTYPAYAGGWGQEQSLEDFLRDGPASPIPSEFLAEVCLAVLAIVNARTRGSSIGRVG
ncbi:MAG: hypothetical protein JNL73_05415 [Anaerolineales bacterium]|nr:hypothetical protein [Anaerolineales bacterium]